MEWSLLTKFEEKYFTMKSCMKIFLVSKRNLNLFLEVTEVKISKTMQCWGFVKIRVRYELRKV